MKKNIIGIDISKKDFYASFENKVSKYDNNIKGIKSFIKTLPANSHCVMESTSTYCYLLAETLNKTNHTAYIVNPVMINNYSKMNLRKAKTDKQDAILIENFAHIAIDDLRPYTVASEDLTECKQVETVIAQLIKQRTALMNQYEALSQYPKINKQTLKTLQKLIDELTKQIKELEAEATRLVKKEHGEMLDKITSIPGIGISTAIKLIALTQGFANFDSAKQVASFFGCCPRVIESGSSVRGRGSISKQGHSSIRSTLYVCALSAMQCNTTCKELFSRLRQKGKPGKVAQLAVVNKLIHQIFAVVKKNEYFDNSFQISLAN